MKQLMWAIGLIVVLLAGPALPVDAAGGGGFHGGGARMSGGGFHGGGARWTGGGGWHGGARGWNGGWHGGWHGGTRVFIGGGFGWWGWPGWWGPGWWGPGWWGANPSVMVQQAPTQFIQQDPALPSAPQYWYYCQNAGAYYPYVKECPGGWMTVVPSPTQPAP